ncbi:hypothetical protein CVT25_014640 [Psilocybe cyanescens]|uniref:HMG box domain-containing protein n=1 Tax=Psilocybe cyanescens TaxID=93625 RepID=A0A409WU36_PSICY|nr:hypothetical protein CVT25_014640 [Psilocybe cyanescens]
MPAFRNVAPFRHSGRLASHIPVTYDKDGWQVADHEVKIEPFDVSIQIPSSLSPSLISPLPSNFEHASPISKSENPASPLADPPFDVDAPSTVPSRKNSHARRRDPGHIPRPRNAFIFFRSAYINSGSATGEGQQNELSRHAGKVWNKMTEEEKRPFCEFAAIEKEEHQAKHPGYVYSPGRSGGKSKPKPSSASVKKKGEASTVLKCNRSPLSDTLSEPSSPVSLHVPTARLPNKSGTLAQRAVRGLLQTPLSDSFIQHSPISDELQYPTYFFSGNNDVPPLPHTEIPELECIPRVKQEEFLQGEREPPSPFHPHLDPVTGQYAYQQYTHDFMSASMPTLPYMSPSSESYNNPAVNIHPVTAIDPRACSYPLAPSPLLCENPYPNADYLVSSNYPFGNEGDLVMQQYTNDLPEQAEVASESTYCDFGMEENQDAFIKQFFDFDLCT